MNFKHMVIVPYFFRGNPLSPHSLFPISSRGSFIYTFPDSTAHTTTFYGPVVDHWLGGTENSPNCKCFHHAGSIRHAEWPTSVQNVILVDISVWHRPIWIPIWPGLKDWSLEGQWNETKASPTLNSCSLMIRLMGVAEDLKAWLRHAKIVWIFHLGNI